jgi:hypothetical protein
MKMLVYKNPNKFIPLMSFLKLIFTSACVLLSVSNVIGHGYLKKPCAQNAKFAFCGVQDAPKNYDGHGLFCGSVKNTYPNYPSKVPFKCGICGDSPNGPFDHEPNGKFYDPRIVETYTRGQTIDITVAITASHMGEFWFEICNLDQSQLSNECFTTFSDRNFTITSYESKDYNMKYTLPADLTCKNCVIRFNWLANNNPTLPNELYKNCAFVTITDNPVINSPSPIATMPLLTSTAPTTISTIAPTNCNKPSMIPVTEQKKCNF